MTVLEEIDNVPEQKLFKYDKKSRKHRQKNKAKSAKLEQSSKDKNYLW